MTAAFAGDAESADLVVAAAGLAVRVGAVLRMASFAVRPAPPRTIAVGPHIEDTVVDEWLAHVEKEQRRVHELVAGLPAVPSRTRRSARRRRRAVAGKPLSCGVVA